MKTLFSLMSILSFTLCLSIAPSFANSGDKPEGSHCADCDDNHTGKKKKSCKCDKCDDCKGGEETPSAAKPKKNNAKKQKQSEAQATQQPTT